MKQIDIIKSSDLGLINTIMYYAEMLDEGIKIIQNEKRACYYFEKAANLGHTDAMYVYALRLLDGTNGAQKDVKKSFKYFEKTATKDHPESFYNYASLLKEGEEGVCERDPQNAAFYFKKSADKKIVEAMYEYGKMKEDGDEKVPIDIDQAKKYYKKAADRNDAKSMVSYGLLIERNAETKQELKEACKYIKQAADKEDSEGLYHYGRLIEEGKGISKDEKEVFRYYKLVANKDCVETMYIVGLKYEKGGVVDKDLKEAYRYFRKALKKGHKESRNKCNELQPFIEMNMVDEEHPQKLYEHSCKLEQSNLIEFSLFYYEKALKLDQFDAMNNYAKLLIKGDDPAKVEEAANLFKLAADNGQVDSMYNYARYMELKNDVYTAIDYYKKSIESSNENYKDSQFKSMNNYSLLTHSLDSDDDYRNNDDARKYLKTAANFGYVFAIYNCGVLYYKGELFPQDYTMAAKYFKTVADKGHAKSISQYSYMLRKSIGVKAKEREAQKYIMKDTS